MLILIIGGSGSGKSEYAEARCMALSPGKKIYIATMEASDAESKKRIARHRRLRDGKGFETLEYQTRLEEAEIPVGATALLECMSNLVANEMFSPTGRGEQMKAARPNFENALTELVLQGVKRLCDRAEHIVIVTNQVFSDGIAYDPETERYLRVLARINNEIAAFADEVVEVVHGIPLDFK